MRKVLTISEDYIKTYSNLSDNVWGDYLLPTILTAQNIQLQQTLGSCLFNKVLDLIEDGSITATTNTAYKTLLDDYIQDFMMYQTITDLIPIIGVKLANIGTVVSNDEHLQNLSESERSNIKQFYQNKADFFTKRLQGFLKANKDLFPELKCGCECDSNIKPTLDSAASTGLFLGGYRSPYRRIIKRKIVG